MRTQRNPAGRDSQPRRLLRFVVTHFHAILYGYFGLGLFLCALLAPPDRVEALGSGLVQRGWHLALLSVVLIAPVPVIYAWRWRRVGR